MPILRSMLIAGLVFLLLLTAAGCGRSRHPNIVLIVIDTLRADHLGCYGYERNTSPSMDSVSENGIVFLNTRGQASWTLPAVSSIFTGLNSREHGAGRRGNAVMAMNYDVPTIPLLLKRQGYVTKGIFNVFLLSEQFGFNKGYDSFSCDWLGHGRAGLSVDEGIEWISTLDGTEPFFLSLHLFDPHDPYDPPAPFDEYFTPSGSEGTTWWPALADGSLDRSDENLEHLKGLYDGEIAWTDAQLERLFSHLRSAGYADNTVIIITSDHGEEFLEHGSVGHGYTMHREILHIPLIISGPGIPSGATDSLLRSQTDILPTILELSSSEIPEHISGYSLLTTELPSRVIPASNLNTTTVDLTASVEMGNRKLIWNAVTDHSDMYETDVDPMELNPLPPDNDLVDSVLIYWSTPQYLPAVIADRETVEAVLRDLGYF